MLEYCELGSLDSLLSKMLTVADETTYKPAKVIEALRIEGFKFMLS